MAGFKLQLPKFNDTYDPRLMRDLVRQLEELAEKIDMGNQYNDVFAEIALSGKYQNRAARVHNIMGRRSTWVNTTDLHDLVPWLGSGAGQQAIPAITGAETWEIVSSSANDAAAGTGAQQIHITYLNTAGLQVEKTGVIPNGTTPVAVTFSDGLSAVQWMEVGTVGSATVAQGNISFRTVGAAVIHEQIVAGGNRSTSGRYTVPSNHSAYLIHWNRGAINNDQDFRLRATVDMFGSTLGTVYLFEDVAYTAINTNGPERNLRWMIMPAGAKIKISTITAGTAGTVRADANFFLVCVSS